MADWFKFYETDLDETRLQYAISKLPEIVSVWVGILSVCCQDKSRTIRWGENEIELFGFSRRLGISIPKVNEAVRLLGEIDYIKLKDGKMTVTDWNSKQSEYCRKRPRATKKAPDSVRSVSGHTPDSVPLEERRVEEIRKEEHYPEVNGFPVRLPVKIPEGALEIHRKSINVLFGRSDSARWGHSEERELFELIQRLDFASELSELVAFKARTKFFPRSVASLLCGWQKTLDQSRNEPIEIKPKTLADKMIEAL